MGDFKFRLAKPSDAKEIANLHWQVRERYLQGIFLSLGKRFLTEIYKIVLDDPWEVVVCAVDENDKIIGFMSNSLNIKHQFAEMKKHRVKLGFYALRAIIMKPSLFRELLQRYRSLDGNKNSPKFVNTEGVRGEYWCWSKEDDSLSSIELRDLNGIILRALGVKEILFEVDKSNKKVYKFHLKVNKAEPLEEIVLPDGRVRVLMKQKI